VDAELLACAIENELLSVQLDYRTRQLIRESVLALRQHWGETRVQHWMNALAKRDQLAALLNSRDFDQEPGFPSLPRRIVDAVKPQTIENFLRELSQHIHKPTRLVIGGAIALILRGAVSRATEDIDLVNEVPEVIREQHEPLSRLTQRFGLRLAHFQSHYLPTGWERRLRSFGVFGELEVWLIDEYDVLLGKLFSKREKDRDDLREAFRTIDKSTFEQHLHDAGAALLADARSREAAKENWYVLFGEQLPV
jgi:hypothetical protein